MASPTWTPYRFDVDWPYPLYYRMGRVLGRGVNSTVYLGTPRWRNGDEQRVIKSVEISQDEDFSKELFEEKEMLRSCSGGLYVVKRHGFEIASDAFDLNRRNHNLILEYIRGGTLKEKILRRRGLQVSQVREVVKDILQGIETIHGNNVVHLDINPTNILQRPVWDGFRRYMHMIIADFGSIMDAGSEQPYGHRLAHRSRDTRYRALELFMNEPINFAVDIWAFGCTILEILKGKPPVKQYNERYNEVLYIPDWYCDDTKDFLRNYLNRNAEERWISHALINHPFLTIPDDGDKEEVFDGDGW